MRFRSIALACALVACLAAGAWAGPLSVSQTTVDFGAMTEGPVARQTITLTNTGDRALTIENVTTS